MTWLARRAVKVPLMTRGIIRNALSGNGLPRGTAFLIYHRVDGALGIELDLQPELFGRQMALLSAESYVVSYEEALSELRTPSDSAHRSVVLTFDDGYEDFYTTVFPVLKWHNLPAILFVTTGFVEEGIPYPMMSNPDAGVAPVTWEMLGEMAESALVTLGAHTHSHPVLTSLPDDRLEEELARPLELFERRLGMRPLHFAYPRGEVTQAVKSHVARHYVSAVAGGGRRAVPVQFDRFAIPRVPIRRSDGWQFFQAKLRGWLEDEEPVYERLRQLGRRD